MLKINTHQFGLKFIGLALLVAMLIGCTGGSDNSDVRTEDDDENTAIDSTETDLTETDGTSDSGGMVDSAATTRFTVIGDVPYDDAQRSSLIALIDAHNARAKSEFVVHVGDIKPGADACDESVYEDVHGILRNFETPTFIVLGDNEYNDCDRPEEALVLWNQYFLHFNENWDFPQEVEYQDKRPENFAWVQKDVLFLGLNLVGSSVHDEAEWKQRLTDDADWVEEKFSEHGENIEATVLFGHANMTEAGPEKFVLFTDRFRAAAKTLGKPVLYMQGDGHFWFRNRPWPEQNILRVQIEGGGEAVQVIVNPDLEEPFDFNREFLE
ncbi:MAG: metallophosphoesterase [Pricia sp.]